MLDKAFSKLFKHPIISVPFIFYALLYSYLSSKLNISTDEILKSLAEQRTLSTNSINTFYLLAILLTSAFIFPLVLSITLTLIKNIVNDKKLTLKAAIVDSFKNYFKIFSLIALSVLLFIVFFFTTILIAYLLISQFDAATGLLLQKATIMIIFTFMLLLVIHVICSISIMVYENLELTKSIAKGLDFSKRYFFRIFGILIAIVIIVPIIISFIPVLLSFSRSVFILKILYAFFKPIVFIYILLLYKSHLINNFLIEINKLKTNITNIEKDVINEINYDNIAAKPVEESHTAPAPPQNKFRI